MSTDNPDTPHTPREGFKSLTLPYSLPQEEWMLLRACRQLTKGGREHYVFTNESQTIAEIFVKPVAPMEDNCEQP